MGASMKLSALLLDVQAQPRAVLDWNLIAEYADDVRGGASFPPVVAFGTESRAWVGDGWHRTHSHIQAEADEIAVDLRPGGLDEAIWHSLSANRDHGLRRTNEDKRRAVERALLARPELSNRDIARHCGVSNMMVGRLRAEMESSLTLLQIETRTVERNGQTYTQQTANIGRRVAERCSDCHSTYEGGHICPSGTPVPERARWAPTHLPPGEPMADADETPYRTLSLDDAAITDDDVIAASGGDSDGRVRAARIRAAYSAGVRSTLELVALNTESVAGVLAPHQYVVARAFARDVRAWCDGLESALDRGIRIVEKERHHA